MKRSGFRRLFPVLLMLALLCVPAASAWAGEGTAELTITVIPEDGGLSGSEAIAGYISRVFGPMSDEEGIVAGAYSSVAGDRLSGAAKTLYDDLAAKVVQVAEGALSTTEFTYKIQNLWTESYTAEELGTSSLGEEADQAFAAIMKADVGSAVSALSVDCPYELYWYDKSNTGGYRMGFNYSRSVRSGRVSYKGTLTLSLRVAKEYAASGTTGTCSVDTGIGQSIQTAKAAAAALVAKNAGRGDLAKLTAYKDAVCSLTDYNYDAVADSSVVYGNPWQLVWVFDGDPDTKVVCEGYSKAFQYLCDLSTFTDSRVISVSGTMSGGAGSGRHMWNIVRSGGKNFLADITNSDTGTSGADGGLFLKGYTRYSSGWYTFRSGLSYTYYCYDESMYGIFGEENLVLTRDEYEDPSAAQEEAAKKVAAFVERCYELILGRSADAAGLETWTAHLTGGTRTAAEIINDFMNSAEYLGRNLTDEDAVEILYRAMLNRSPDAAGMQTWLDALERGASYADIINGFCSSEEFTALCSEYGITAGSVKTEEEDSDKVRAFVKRCYRLILGRSADESGLETWTTQLKTGKMSASVIILQFMSSDEFQSKEASDEEIVEILYRTMLNRTADEAGRQNWLNHMASGATYVDIIAGFCDSGEFHNVCAEYGIDPGYVDVEDSDKVRAFVTRCYRLILNRAPDAAGQADWTSQLKNNTRNAAEIIFEFMTSDEYLNRKMSDADTVEILYRTMLGRESDPEGRQNWLDNLAKGQTVVHIINGFCTSAEFRAICESYGITPGSVAEEELTVLSKAVQARRDAPKAKKEKAAEEASAEAAAGTLNGTAAEAAEPADDDPEIIIPGEGVVGTPVQSSVREEKAAEFIARCYRAALNREAGPEEMRDWVSRITEGGKSPADIVRGFLFSEEFKNRGLGPEDTVRVLYRICMNREADPEGLAFWTEKLEGGESLETVIKGFTGSAEFKAILKDMKQ